MAGAFQCWVKSITYYQDYYEDRFLILLIITSLKNNVANVFDWISSTIPGDAKNQNLVTLLQRLIEHYCGSLTFYEQRNTVENLWQNAHEDNFLIGVGSAVNSLAKDWKGALTEEELKALHYEISLNEVKEDVYHMLDLEVAKCGQLPLTETYCVVKKYKTYVTCNKCLKGMSPYTGQ